MEYPRVTREGIAHLKRVIGEDHVSSGESNLDLHSRDESYHEPHRPDVVVWPQKTEDVVAVFPTIRDACDAVCEIIRYGLNPAALELMDAAVVAEINRDQKMTLVEKPMLFLEFHNVNGAALEHQFGMVEELLGEHRALKIERGIGADERARLWEVRHGALESIKRNHPGKSVLLVDTCVPISRYSGMVDKAKEAVEREGATGFFWGHAGDGNLHLGLLYASADLVAREAVDRVNRDVVEHSIAAGGSCTGEHGVGIGKLSFMTSEHGNALEYMRRVKAALDPKGILNPGKMLPE